MNNLKIIAISFLFGALLFLQEGYSAPVISSPSMQESDIWLWENAVISVNCTETDGNSTITRVYADVTGPDSFSLQGLNFSRVENTDTYLRTISASERVYKRGLFTAAIHCLDDFGTNSSSITFSASNLSLEIKSVTSPKYIGEDAEINVVVKKNDTELNEMPAFGLLIDGSSASFLNGPPFPHTSNGWTLRFSTSSLSAGNRTITITANYNRASLSAIARLELRQPIEFSVLGIDRTEVQAGNEIIATMKAMDRNVPIPIISSYLSIQVDSTPATIAGISESAGNYNVRITVPSVSSGTRQLKIAFNYGNFSKTENRTVTYVIPISGKIAGSDGKGMGVKLNFNEKVVNTNAADGAYSAYLAPGTYKVTMTHDASTLELNGVQISSFDDPIKYYYLPSLDVPGIKEAGIFVYEIALDYSDAYLRMKYDEGKVSDESALNVYECANWNSGRKECVSGWHEVSSSIDIVRNIASANVSEAHAYAIGTDESVDAEAGLDKASYFLNEKMKLSGVVRDGSGNTVSGANITARIEGTDKVVRAVSGIGGAYSVEISAPPSEGKYVLAVSIEKRPYISSAKRLEFSVAKSRDLSIVATEVVRVAQGESTSAEFKIISLGQADISDLKISIKGVPSNYYTISPQSIDILKPGEEKKISVTFSIPRDAAKTTLGATFELSGGFSAAKSFGLTIIAAETQSTALSNSTSSPGNSSSFSFPTALAALYPSDGAVTGLLVFAVISLSSAAILRRMRLSKTGFSLTKSPVRSLLFDIKKKVVEPKGTSEKTAKKALRQHRKEKLSKYARRW